MKLILTYSLLMLLVFGSSVIVFAQSGAEKAIGNYISREAKKQDADEYTEDRKIVYGDLDRDGDKDAVVQFTLEGFGGGNNFAQTLAVFINQNGVYKFAVAVVVGSKLGESTSTLKSIRGKNIYLETESCPEPPQGICENPKKGQATIFFSNGKLTKGRGTLF